MKSIKVSIAAFIFAIVFIFSATKSAKAVELITNGGFESATAFQGWTVVNSPSPWRAWQNTATGNGGGFTSVSTTTVVQGTKNAWQGMTDNSTANSQWQLYQVVNIPVAMDVQVSWRDRYQINHTQFCPTATCQPKRYFVEITNSAGTTVLQTLHTQSTIGNVNQDTGWVTHSVFVTGLSGQTVRLRFRGTETTPLTGPGQIEIDAVSMNSVAPSAADGSVTGRVSLPSGRGISRATLSITDSQTGEVKTATTNPFGYYRFTELETGHFYILNVARKGYIFEPDSQSFQVNDNLEGINFIGSPPE